MSTEVQLAHPCSHMVMEEVVPLADDRRSLFIRAPVASTNIVRVLANDETYVPPGGLYSQAQITGAVGGPFRVVDCENTFTVRSSTESASITLPVGSRVEPELVARLLVARLASVAVEVLQGHLVLTDVSSVGLESSLVVGGNAATSLGFDRQRGARGRQVYPAWELASREDTVANRYPRFREPVRANPRWKVTYTTLPARCPRCGATYVENDQRFDLTGEAILIENENLLYQAALKILLTRIRSNPYQPFYGSSLQSRIGVKAIGAAVATLTEDVQNALRTMQQLQSAQAKYQRITARERLYAVNSVRVSPSAEDPTVFRIDVVVSNAAGAPVSITIVFSVPGAVALVGTNGLSLGLEAAGLTSNPTRLIQ